MAALNLEYADKRTTVVARANLREGFDLVGGEYLFKRKESIAFREDTKFNCHFRLKNLRKQESFPAFLENELPLVEWELGALGLRKGVLEIKVKIVKENFQYWSSNAKNPAFKMQASLRPTYPPTSLHGPNLSNYPNFSMQPEFWLDFYLSIQGDAQQVFPLGYENFEDRSVVSGGRPESDRRKF